MKTNQSRFDRPAQPTQPGELMPTQPIEPYHPSCYGDSYADIFSSIAILVSAIAKLITAFKAPKK
jgi:hypothetical protein